MMPSSNCNEAASPMILDWDWDWDCARAYDHHDALSHSCFARRDWPSEIEHQQQYQLIFPQCCNYQVCATTSMLEMTKCTCVENWQCCQCQCQCRCRCRQSLRARARQSVVDVYEQSRRTLFAEATALSKSSVTVFVVHTLRN